MNDADALRVHLETSNGMRGLELLDTSEPERAVRQFRRDGFAVVRDVLDAAQIETLRAGCAEAIAEITALDPGSEGNRGAGRYSFGGSSLTRSQLHRPAWQMLLEIDFVIDLVTAIFGSPHFVLRAASGDFCLPGTLDYQRLHSDVRDWTSDDESPSAPSTTRPAAQVSAICPAPTCA